MALGTSAPGQSNKELPSSQAMSGRPSLDPEPEAATRGCGTLHRQPSFDHTLSLAVTHGSHGWYPTFRRIHCAGLLNGLGTLLCHLQSRKHHCH